MIWFRLGPDAAADGPAGAGPAPALDEVLAGDRPDGGRHRPHADRRAKDLLQLSYDELLGHAVALAREAVGADAAYALIADEDGELRMRAAAGRGVPYLRLDEAPGLPGRFDRYEHVPRPLQPVRRARRRRGPGSAR